MDMRAKVFDDWTNKMLFNSDEKTIVLHIGCGLDSRCLRVKESITVGWIAIFRM